MKQVYYKVVNLEPFLPVLIYPESTGFLWGNQVGGLRCLSMDLEGILLPCPNADNFQYALNKLHREFCSLEGLSVELVEKLHDIFIDLNIPLRIQDRQASVEAWIYVTIQKNNDGILRTFADEQVILTWKNCD